MPRGIFRLKQVYEEQLSGNWSEKGDVWNTPSPFTKALPFGYFGGGSPSGSTVDRINYSNDTATAVAKGPLSATRYFLGATGNQNFGYFGGGNPGPVSTIDRVDYSNDTATALAKGPLSVTRYGVGATGNSDFGYFAGGYNYPTYYTTVDRIDYSNDTGTTPTKGPLSVGRRYLAATSAGANANPQ